MARKSRRIEITIAVFKLLKAAMLLAIVVLIVLARDHLGAGTAHVASALGLGGNRTVAHMSTRLGRVERDHIPWLAFGVLAYAGVFSVEGIGLARGRRWAEWLTVVVTLSFIPWELFELIEHRSPLKAVLLGANLAIVVYLAIRLFRTKGD